MRSIFAGWTQKNRLDKEAVYKRNAGSARRLYLFDEAGLDGLDRDEDALRAAVGGADADLLQVRAELALGDRRDVRADAAALLRLTFTVNDGARGWAFAGDCADSGHG